MTGRNPGYFCEICWRYLSPILLVALFISIIYKSASEYPGYYAWNKDIVRFRYIQAYPSEDTVLKLPCWKSLIYSWVLLRSDKFLSTCIVRFLRFQISPCLIIIKKQHNLWCLMRPQFENLLRIHQVFSAGFFLYSLSYFCGINQRGRTSFSSTHYGLYVSGSVAWYSPSCPSLSVPYTTIW